MCLSQLRNKLSKQEIEVILQLRELQKKGWGTLEVIVKDKEIKLLKATNQVALDK